MKKFLPILVILGLLALAVMYYVNTNNRFVEMKGQATKQWANVESSYQRRSDLIPNLVNTVKGAADFEKETLTAVIEARAKATSTTIDPSKLSAENMAQFQQAQDGLSGALSRLLVSVERYPELKANQNFRDLQAQLEGTENRINVERNRFNDIAGEYNITIAKIPASIIANLASFDALNLLKSAPGTENAPTVEF